MGELYLVFCVLKVIGSDLNQAFEEECKVINNCIKIEIHST